MLEVVVVIEVGIVLLERSVALLSPLRVWMRLNRRVVVCLCLRMACMLSRERCLRLWMSICMVNTTTAHVVSLDWTFQHIGCLCALRREVYG